MANVKISELTALTAPAAADVIAIVDTSATETKKMTACCLLTKSFEDFTVGDDLCFSSAGAVINFNSADVTITHASNSLTFDGGSVIFNEAGGAFDVRMEGDTEANLFIADASADRIGIGTATPATLLHVQGAACITGNITSAGNFTAADLIATDDVCVADDLCFSAAGGVINFNSGDVTITHSTNALTFDGGGVVFNEAGGAFDLRIEGDSEANLFIADASTDRIGIGTATPATLLHVQGAFTGTGVLSIDDTTDTSSTTTGSIHTDGGVGLAKALWVGTTSCFVGATTHASTLTVGVDDTGHDVKFFGASAGAFMLYDESADTLDVRGATAAGPGVLKLTTGELTNVDGGILGRLEFQAPLDSAGTDAILVAASIWAEANATFSASVNTTDLVFATATSATATEKMRITSAGCVGIATNSGVSSLDIVGSDAGKVIAFQRASAGSGSRTFGAYIGGAADCTLIFTAGDTCTIASAFCCPILALEAGSAYVGIGTNAPSNHLHIEDNSSNAVVFIDQNGAGDLLVLKCGATERFRLTATGKLGVGTTVPDSQVHIYTGAGGAAADSAADELNIEGSSSTVGMTISGPASNEGNIFFADDSSSTVGRITYAHAANCFYFTTNSVKALYIDSAQNVGVGAPVFETQSSWVSMNFGFNASIIAQCALGAGNALWMVQNAYRSTAPSWKHINEDEASAVVQGDGSIAFYTAVSAAADATAAFGAKMTVNNDGCVCVNCGLQVGGALSKGSGTFKIDHPLESKKDTHYLSHSFIEGPQADLMYRGIVQLVDGSAEINVDTVSGMTEGTFVSLNRCAQVFTTNESNWDAVKGSVTGNTLTIESNAEASTACISWMVVGERCDPHIMDTTITDDDGRVIVESEK